jgi:hypothetical protein
MEQAADDSEDGAEPAAVCEEIDEPRKYACQYAGCRLQFKHSSALDRHIRRHTDHRPYACRYVYCNKRFHESAALALHERVHTGERPFVCSVPDCGKAFKASGALSRHGRVHADHRPFLCDFEGCDKAFKDSCALTVHRRVHTGERPYVCNVAGCGKRFKESGTLTRHIGLHTRQQLQQALDPPPMQPLQLTVTRMQTAYAQPIFPWPQLLHDVHPCAPFGFACAPTGCCYPQLQPAHPAASLVAAQQQQQQQQQQHFLPAPHLVHGLATNVHGGMLSPFIFDYGPHCQMGAMLHAANMAGAVPMAAQCAAYQPSAPGLVMPSAPVLAASSTGGAPSQPPPLPPPPPPQQGWTPPPSFAPGPPF